MDTTIITIIIIAAVLVSPFFLGRLLTKERVDIQKASLTPIQEPEESTKETIPQKEQFVKTQIPTKTTAPIVITQPKLSPPLIDTFITSGPKDGEIIEETNKITFKFSGKTYTPNTQERIYFETKLQGFDTDWVPTSSKDRTIYLSAGVKEYTFWVRAKTSDLTDFTPAKRTFKMNISPYFEKIRISRVEEETSYRSSLIILNTSLGREERINITGWYIEGEEGKIIIPQGVEKYYHYYNSYVNEDISIKQGDAIYLSSAFNPLGKDRNFRPNKCLGFLADSFDFPIPMPRNCPRPEIEEISHLEPCCEEFILRLRPCEIPDYSENPKIYSDSECVSYLDENFNNRGCFKKYSNDDDFVENEWHIYLDKNIVVNNDCDILYLRDQNGLLIDKYSYGRPICQ